MRYPLLARLPVVVSPVVCGPGGRYDYAAGLPDLVAMRSRCRRKPAGTAEGPRRSRRPTGGQRRSLAEIDDIVPRAVQQNVALYKLRVAEKEATDDVNIRFSKAVAAVAEADSSGRTRRPTRRSPVARAADHGGPPAPARAVPQNGALDREGAKGHGRRWLAGQGKPGRWTPRRPTSNVAGLSPPWTPWSWDSPAMRASGCRRATRSCG